VSCETQIVVGWRGALLIAALGLICLPAQAESGSWRSHEIEFDFLGFTSTYSCDGLQSKLQVLLRTLSARHDAVVSTLPCGRGFGVPDKFARASLRFATLEPAEALAAPASDASAVAKGQWRQVVLAPHRPSALDAGDCELVEQFRDKILPLFATRALHNEVHCIPFQESGGYELQLEVFAPLEPS
jgi:hypothetical protein